MQGAEVLVVGTDAWTQVVSDRARAEGGYRARKAWGQKAWKEEKDRERASRAAQQVRRAATLTAELAAQSESKVFEVCSQPPGLCDEPAAERSFEPLAAKSSHLVSNSPPCSSLSLSTSETAANMLPATDKLLQGTGGLKHSAGSFRATRPRSTTRALDTAAMLEETLSLFVEATGKDEASMRQQLMSKRPEELRRNRELWKTRVEEKQRFHTKKKEAWEFFRRLPSFKPKKQEDFEEEFRQKVMTGYSSGSLERRERYLDEWTVELQKKALKEDRRLEARERAKMGEEDSSSRRRTEWKRILSLSPFLRAVNRDAGPGVVFCSGKSSVDVPQLANRLHSGDPCNPVWTAARPHPDATKGEGGLAKLKGSEGNSVLPQYMDVTGIIYGLALGYLSTIIPVISLGITILVAHSLCGMFGVTLGALGILGTLTMALTIDAFGPISDNAGGVAEMAQLGEWVSHSYLLVLSLSSS